ncbi:MAG: hypothetical protein GX600_11690 [Dehalococcoidia bacterium]|nr:hypothetical protein [Dehalococcoidia bacterium]
MSIAARARRLWSDGGASGLARGAGRFTGMLAKKAFFSAEYYVHEFDLMALDDTYAAAPIDNLEVHIVESDEDVSRLVERGYEDCRLTVPGAKRCLRSGAVGLCAYVGGTLAHIAWVGLNEEAKRSFDALAYRVRFDEREGCSGGSWTFPSFRGKGLYRHVMWRRFTYLREHGCLVCRHATGVHNVPSLRGQAVFPCKLEGTLRFVRVFGIDRYSFKPWDHHTEPDDPKAA